MPTAYWVNPILISFVHRCLAENMQKMQCVCFGERENEQGSNNIQCIVWIKNTESRSTRTHVWHEQMSSVDLMSHEWYERHMEMSVSIRSEKGCGWDTSGTFPPPSCTCALDAQGRLRSKPQLWPRARHLYLSDFNPSHCERRRPHLLCIWYSNALNLNVIINNTPKYIFQQITQIF